MNGEVWRPSEDDCFICGCMASFVMCSYHVCPPLTCENPILIAGRLFYCCALDFPKIIFQVAVRYASFRTLSAIDSAFLKRKARSNMAKAGEFRIAEAVTATVARSFASMKFVKLSHARILLYEKIPVVRFVSILRHQEMRF